MDDCQRREEVAQKLGLTTDLPDGALDRVLKYILEGPVPELTHLSTPVERYRALKRLNAHYRNTPYETPGINGVIKCVFPGAILPGEKAKLSRMNVPGHCLILPPRLLAAVQVDPYSPECVIVRLEVMSLLNNSQAELLKGSKDAASYPPGTFWWAGLDD